MKVTIINNGTTSVVLKPESEEEVLALKKLGKENTSIQFHEKLQIMTEPVPNALVISVDSEE
jgi:hypothetical protein